jgi:hypothetical protein
MATGTRIIDTLAFVHAFHEAVPASANPTWVSMKGYDHMGVLISYANGASGVVGAAITLNQAQNVAGLNSKPLGFTKAWSVVPDSTSVLPVALTIAANTFTTDVTVSTTGWYFIDIDSFTTDQLNKFTCVQVAIANATAATIGAWYLMGVSPRYSGGFDSMMNPLAN